MALLFLKRLDIFIKRKRVELSASAVQMELLVVQNQKAHVDVAQAAALTKTKIIIKAHGIYP